MAGKVQLAVTGVQDEYLTGDPQITYFLKSFKRHTKFAIDIKDNQFDGTHDFGQTVKCVIPRKGDLIKTIFLKVKLSELSTADTSNVGYTDSIGNAIVEYADLIIGGQTVQRITGEYMEIYSDLQVIDSQQKSLEYLIGKTNTRTGLGPASSTNQGQYGLYPRTFIIPLPFYFYRHPSLAIPMNAINKQEIEVHIKFRELNQLVVSPDASVVGDTTGNIVSSSCPVEYVYISQDERDFIESRPINYIIEQLQVARTTIQPNEVNKKSNIRFVNPVKELYFVIQNKEKVNPDIITGNDWFNFTNSEKTTSPSLEQLADLELEFNGETRIENNISGPLFLRNVQSMIHHTRSPSRYIYLYSFALEPESHYPTGQVNMSRIINKILKIRTTSNTKERELRIYAKSLNILRVEHGLAGVIFTDNNFI